MEVAMVHLGHRHGVKNEACTVMAKHFRFWMFKLLLMVLVHPSMASLQPRVSFSLGSSERVLGFFNSTNARSILLSSDGQTLFVGVQDALISLDVSQSDNIILKDRMDWKSSPKNLDICKRASKMDCGNFISVLQFFNSTHLYACGTNSYGPQGIIVPANSLNAKRKTMENKNCCPYSANQRNAAIIVDEELYTATALGFFGDKHVISRCHSKTHSSLTLDTDTKLLMEPVFIRSTHVASEKKILVFFTEIGDLTGDLLTDSFTVSRVAQICTNDKGGMRVLQKRWTSFAKAQLVCQQEQGVQFNILQDIVEIPPEDGSPDGMLFYGVFTSQWSLSSQSAVCVFSLADVKAAFAGDYRTFNLEENYWLRQENSDGNFGKCGLFNNTDIVLNQVKKTFLAQTPVHSMERKLLLSSTERYSHVAAQRTRASNGHLYTVLFLLTESGFLHKVVLLEKVSHVVEEIQIVKRQQTLKSIILSTSKRVLFIGSTEGVFRVPVSNCSAYPDCAECVLARDPFCGWDSGKGACTDVSIIGSNLQQDVERGNVSEQCSQAKATTAIERRAARLGELLVLPCKTRSSLSKVAWRFPNNSAVSQNPYLQTADGSLAFLVTADTVNVYHCVSVELGFEQTISSFSINLQIGPRSLPPSMHQNEEMEDVPDDYIATEEPEPAHGRENNAFITPEKRTKQTSDMGISHGILHQKSYYAEMVAVCILFVISLCAMAGFVVLWRDRARCSRTSSVQSN